MLAWATEHCEWQGTPHLVDPHEKPPVESSVVIIEPRREHLANKAPANTKCNPKIGIQCLQNQITQNPLTRGLVCQEDTLSRSESTEPQQRELLTDTLCAGCANC